MRTIDQQTDGNGGGPPRRALAVGLTAALVLGLVVGAIWLLQGSREAPDAVGPSTVVLPALEAVAESNPPPQELPASLDDALPTAAAAPVEAVPPDGHHRTTDGWREIRGMAVRVTDQSPVDAATIIALSADAGANNTDEPSQARTARDGSFTLYVPRDVNFRAQLGSSGSSPGGSQPDTRVPVSVEWANGDAQGSDVRLVLDTGWHLDVFVVDGDNRPHAGVLVKGGGRMARSDTDGRCTLLDLPYGGDQLRVTVQAPGGKAVSYGFDAPSDGSLSKEVTLKAP